MVKELKTTINTASKRSKDVFSIKKMFEDLKAASFLGKQLFVRDTKAMFRKSKLGLLWAFVPPFLTAGAWIFLNFTGAVKITDTGIPYPIFVICGTLLYTTFLDAIKAPADSVNAGKSMISKLNFPREALLVNSMYTILFNFGLKLIALIVLTLILGFALSWSSLYFIFGAFMAIAIGYSLGVIMIPFQMLYDDFGRMIAIGGQIMLYLTPVVYPIPVSGILRTINIYNPLTYIVSVPRNMFTVQPLEHLHVLFGLFFLSLIILFLGWVLYRITMPIVIERVGA